MTAFSGYARYYDLLYRDKDYAAEAAFVHDLIRVHVPGARRILELGCGTGAHAALLAGMGYDVLGLDASAAMIAVANQRCSNLPSPTASRLRHLEADARTFRSREQFDVVIALFHVMSYQLADADLSAIFARVQAQMEPDGAFLFDCWYGPAVLQDPPVSRVKRVADEITSAVRTAEPVLHPEEHVVDVHYRLVATDLRQNTMEELREVHRMRYLFRPELETLARQHGLQIVAAGEWLTARPPDTSSWYVYFVVKHAGQWAP